MADAVNAPASQAGGEAGSTLGLVPNGGRARRLGGVDKGLVLITGQPMIARAIERLRLQSATPTSSAGASATVSAFFHQGVNLGRRSGVKIGRRLTTKRRASPASALFGCLGSNLRACFKSPPPSSGGAPKNDPVGAGGVANAL